MLNRILEATPSVEPMSLIHRRHSNYETMYYFDVSDSSPELYLEYETSQNFDTISLLNANSTTLLWVLTALLLKRTPHPFLIINLNEFIYLFLSLLILSFAV